MATHSGLAARLGEVLGTALIAIVEHAGETTAVVQRDALVTVIAALRDAEDLKFNQLTDLCGADYPERAERFEIVVHLLSMAHNLRLRVKVSTDGRAPVPSLTTLFPNAGWYERETWDCYGVMFAGNPDMRRILTDYGFEGHPFRKDFPLTGHVELRWSEEHKRVVYEPVKLAQDFRSFDFLSPWEGTDYVLPGDEKAAGQ
ncbi:NADH-quinone oxidoreductase subunit C [Sandarakinorhabdus sp. AAP62]|uniref:NADH-quinone oxidoreductase subunit C n=1 Tax=Sandarakinorhabdus sp. AAP62 TaxID=1248916 RepID=UPI001267805C|nr:NADH-quinone oxidoreductase subunit C [Sandarakinorhabdus sp. AAP62]